MIQGFFVPGVLPGLNDMIAACKIRRGKWSKYLDMKQSYGSYVKMVIKKAKLQPMQKAAIHFEWREPSSRRDPDNIRVGSKFILDALVSVGVLPGDGWKHIVSLSDTYTVDKAKPGVMVELVGD